MTSNPASPLGGAAPRGGIGFRGGASEGSLGSTLSGPENAKSPKKETLTPPGVSATLAERSLTVTGFLRWAEALPDAPKGAPGGAFMKHSDEAPTDEGNAAWQALGEGGPPWLPYTHCGKCRARYPNRECPACLRILTLEARVALAEDSRRHNPAARQGTAFRKYGDLNGVASVTRVREGPDPTLEDVAAALGCPRNETPGA